VPLLEAFAASAATAVWMAQDVAAQGLRRSIEASERERTRWARELHDDTLQQLAMINVGVAAAARSEDVEMIRRRLSGVTEQIEDGISSLRVLIADLRPAALDVLGVQPAVEALVARVGAAADLPIELSVHLAGPQDGSGTRLTAAIEDTVYRSIQEALTNMVKHAHAHHARVAIDERADMIEIEITDDGVGFDPDAPASGFGLMGMRERVAPARATLEIRSVPGSGSTVVLTLPAAHR
jgi:signal transduction histidine kinase